MSDAGEERELTHERLLIGVVCEARFGRGPVQFVAVEDGIRERIEGDSLIIERRRPRRFRRARVRCVPAARVVVHGAVLINAASFSTARRATRRAAPGLGLPRRIASSS